MSVAVASTLVLKVTDHRLLNLLYGSVMPLLALDIVALLQLSLSAGDHLLQHSPSSYTNVTGLTVGFSSWVVHRLHRIILFQGKACVGLPFAPKYSGIV